MSCYYPEKLFLIEKLNLTWNKQANLSKPCPLSPPRKKVRKFLTPPIWLSPPLPPEEGEIVSPSSWHQDSMELISQSKGKQSKPIIFDFSTCLLQKHFSYTSFYISSSNTLLRGSEWSVLSIKQMLTSSKP